MFGTCALLVACQGSSIGTTSSPLHVSPDVAGGQLSGSPAVESVCKADSDCGPLAVRACLIAVCEPTTHRCIVGHAPELAVCDDGDPCSVESLCRGRRCLAAKPRDCDDGLACTKGTCDAATGECRQTPAPGDCDDANPCTAGDHCAGGACVGGTNVCACTADGDCAGKDGADKCVGALVCVASSCAVNPATTVACTTDQPCRVAVCDSQTGSCTTNAIADGAPCSDDNVCTVEDSCIAGACTAGAAVACLAGACASASCDPKSGCGADSAKDGVACDDGSVCTANDACHGGVCAGASSCECFTDAECAGQPGVPACAGALACRGGRCEIDLAQATPCPTGGPCTIAICGAKGCENAVLPANSPCDDGNLCTHSSTCDAAGLCSAGSPLNCDDGNACTTDACHLSSGCTSTAAADGQLCDDAQPCTTASLCAAGACAPAMTTCDDGLPCTFDWCDPAKAGDCLHVHLDNGAACQDGDPCTTGDACQQGVCAAKNTTICDDANVCTKDRCAVDDAGIVLCVYAEFAPGTVITCDDGKPCSTDDRCIGKDCVGIAGGCECQIAADCAAKEDGDVCNGTLACVAGGCVVDPASVVTCQKSSNPCTSNVCLTKTGQCVEQARPEIAGGSKLSCDDANACTTGEVCLGGGACGAGLSILCDDGDPCSVDACQPTAGCVATNADPSAGIPCDDGNVCTKGDVCGAGGCQSGKNACQCNTDGDCAVFDDGDKCNGALVCKSGACLSDGNNVSCSSAGAGACQAARCQPSTGKCAFVGLPTGSTCATAGECPSPGLCGVAGCTATAPVCDDSNPCTQDACDPVAKACTHTITAGATCDDGDDCTDTTACGVGGACGGGNDLCTCVNDGDCPDDGNACNGSAVCVAKKCGIKAGSVVVCDAKNDTPCSVNTCAPSSGACAQKAAATGAGCDDGDACTTGTVCASGVCGGGGKPDCDDQNPCTSDACSPATGCFSLNNTAECDDGNTCTVGDSCTAGQCVSGPNNCDCKSNADCTNDSDACNGVVICVANKCQLDPKTVVVCDGAANTSCRANLCDKGTGTCSMTNFPDTTDCDDATVCTSKDRCQNGVCAGDAVSCDDKNPCSQDSCDPKAGCSNVALDKVACDDANSCTTGEACAAGVCKGGTDVCGVCKVDADCVVKDDGNLCNGILECKQGSCQAKPNSVVTCADDGNACTAHACAPSTGACVTTLVSDGAACDDASVCSGSSACLSGSCVGVNTKVCDDGNGCTTDACDPKQGCITTTRAGQACDDGNPCTAGDVCLTNLTCFGLSTCECTADADCKAKDDADLCNGSLTCQANKCAVDPKTVVACDTSKDGDCRVTACVAATGQCVSANRDDGSGCDDATACTTGDRCAAGQCVGTKLACDDGNGCTTDACDAAKGCQHTANDNGTCDDGNKCTAADACVGGACKPGNNTCQCQTTADCGGFEDGDLCNGTLICSANRCVINAATVVSCGPGSTCTQETCDAKTGKCSAHDRADGTACGGAELCGGSGTCSAGTCNGASGCASDGNVCTLATCDGKGHCSQVPQTGACDDGDFCTVGDTCQAGKCIGKGQCNCANDGDCTGFDDGDKCNGVFTCQTGQCRFDPTSVVTCSGAANLCKSAFCQAASGKCVTTDKPNGTKCPDNDACTIDESCVAGFCQTAKPDCNDNNPCTTDACASASGCTHSAAGSITCDDGDPCTPASACLGGVCRGFGNTCSCNNDGDCKQDGDLCNGVLSCQSGTCRTKPGSVVTCPASTVACFSNTCTAVTGKCTLVPAANGAPCDDVDGCTGGDSCIAGQCIGVKVDCDDKVACTADSCDPKTGCANIANNAACDDGNACTGDECNKGSGCRNIAAIGAPCNDQSDCTQGETCVVSPKGPVCGGGTNLLCDDKNACTNDSCGGKGCEFVANTGPCDDGSLCTKDEKCVATKCVGTPVTCPDNNPCTDDRCDVASGKCNNIPTDGGGCDDGDACTGDGACKAGACAKGAALNCDDANPCTNDSCGTSGCVNSEKTGACDDGDACTGGDACAAGKCIPGTTKSCDDGNDCTADSCDKATGACSNTGGGTQCNDNNPCTTDECDPADGSCKSTPAPGTKCDDNNACTNSDGCDASGQCVGQGGCDDGNGCTADACVGGACTSTPATGPCDDNNTCTTGEQCDGGVCKSPPADPGCCAKDSDCNDNYACSTDACGDTGCVQTAVTCADDGNECTVQACQNGTCGTFVPTSLAPVTLYGENFDDGVANGIYVSSDNKDVTWSISAKRSKSTANALYAGNAAAGNYDSGKSTVSFTLPPLALRAKGTIKLVFSAQTLLADQDCNKDVLKLIVQAGTKSHVESICATSNGFVDHIVSLSSGAQDFRGSTVTIRFVFDTVDASNNAAEGVYIDDIAVVATTSGAGCCKEADDCNDDNQCTFDACASTTGKCTNTVTVGQFCDDGSQCTSSDSCVVSGQCEGIATSCSDGDACTQDDCDPQTGKCSSAQFATVLQDFSAGTDGFSLQLQGQNVGQAKWQISTKAPPVNASALYVGTISADGTHSIGSGTWIGTATYKSVTIPASAVTAFARFKYRFDTTEGGIGGACAPNVDRLQLLIDGQSVAERCTKQVGFATVQYDLKASIGKPVQVGIRALVVGPPLSPANGGEGAWFDDFEIAWTCTP